MNASRYLTVLSMALYCVLSLSPAATAQDWIYHARSGDTLWDLCLKYTNKPGCWIELGKYNNIANDRRIPPGSDIRIPQAWLLVSPVVGRVQRVQGEVLYDEKSDGHTTPLAAGQTLLLGSRIISRQGNAKITFGDYGSLLLRPESKLDMDSLSSGSESGQAAEISLGRGDVEVKVNPRSRSRFEIRTPSAIAAVRGTEYRVSSQSAGGESTRSEVLSGAVAVTASDSLVVPAGFGIKAQQGQTLGKPRELPAAPVTMQDKFMSPLPVAVQWQAGPKAVAWQLDLLSDTPAGELIASWTLAEPRISLTDLGAGCYQVALRAIDAEGFNGMETRRPVCVIAQLPAPARMAIENIPGSVYQYRVTWDAPAGAVEYLVEVAHDAQFTEIISSGMVKTTNALVTAGRANPFYVRVTAVDKYRNNGLPGIAVEHNKSWFSIFALTTVSSRAVALV